MAASAPPRLTVDEAVGRLPQAVVALFEDRLRGQFREVRTYVPRVEVSAASTTGAELENDVFLESDPDEGDDSDAG